MDLLFKEYNCHMIFTGRHRKFLGIEENNGLCFNFIRIHKWAVDGDINKMFNSVLQAAGAGAGVSSLYYIFDA